MWQRLIRLLTVSLNMYSFYANPVRYIFSLLMILLIPYLAYIFWGTLVILILTGLGFYMLYRLVANARKGSSYS